MSKLRRGNILIVDDEKGMCHILKRMISDQGYTVDTANTGEEALSLFDKEDYHAAMLDVRMPGMDGITLLGRIKQRSPDTMVIMMTAYGTVETAVTAMKRGAYEYITKPFNNDEVLHIINNAMERVHLLDRAKYLAQQLEERTSLQGIIGQSKKMNDLFFLIEKVAPTDSTVLILGESGTGKELVAHAVHNQSPRKEEKFLAINCGALPRELIESELFGHEKGAFSGAHQRKIGLFEAADEGTVFLDEIGDLPMELQVKILRVLEQKEIRRIGSVESKKVDVRILAATNRDLRDDVKTGSFREDLFYRLSIMDLHLPPLRDRKEDIPALVEHFIRSFNQKMNRSVDGVTPEALRILMNHDWPGNVRELENIIQRCMILRDTGTIQGDDLPPTLLAAPPSVESPLFDPELIPFLKAREAFEHRYLESLLNTNQGNVTRSALMAGISRRHLQELMKKYDLRSGMDDAGEGI
ncbi:MAG: sigma-54 dependent transcriptional regulator [bacterium]|jgi:DNA-binding NtrC family response regulator|nr:sigma-54 dependent transcriptional regulator [bacterium]